jgi:SAM-dependent methyltransferase
MLRTGVGRVVAFNWPKYAAGVATIAAGAAAPGPIRRPARAGAALAAAWVAGSLAATWWAYDRSPLYRWRWLTSLLPAPPARYAVISAGLDEVSPALRRLYPAAEPILLDLHDPARPGSGSIRRARALVAAPAASRPARPGRLPVPTAGLDAAFLVFAAHELRVPADRAALFAEVGRTLRPGGRLVLVEHLRDAGNLLAYGPGAWHFYPRPEWLRLARTAGLTLAAEAAVTRLVRALVFER